MSEPSPTREAPAAAEELASLLGYRFHDPRLLVRALTHRSYVNEVRADDDVGDNERLEFLGDAVLGLVAARRLYDDTPGAREGDLTRRRAAWVSADAIAARLVDGELPRHLRVGRGVKNAGLDRSTNILADAFEAVIGAVFLDGGLEAADAVVVRLLGLPPAQVPADESAKTRLQERIQQLLGVVPAYEVTRVRGPDHAPVFSATVRVHGRVLGASEGPSTKEATRRAAIAALALTEALDDDALRAHVAS